MHSSLGAIWLPAAYFIVVPKNDRNKRISFRQCYPCRDCGHDNSPEPLRLDFESQNTGKILSVLGPSMHTPLAILYLSHICRYNLFTSHLISSHSHFIALHFIFIAIYQILDTNTTYFFSTSPRHTLCSHSIRHTRTHFAPSPQSAHFSTI